MTQDTANTKKKNIVLERTLRGSLEDIWELWTTKDGIESWWGPEGFSVTVQKLELRPKGELLYTMTATAEPQIAFMKQAGMPLATVAKITYTEVVPQKKLRYVHVADFIPGVEPYDVETTMELQAKDGAVHLVLTLDPMHDDVWTGRMAAGWESELRKLEQVIANRHA